MMPGWDCSVANRPCQLASVAVARSDRLLRLLHVIRTFPSPVTAAVLARETGVSQRTLYRDIDALRAAGALIDGAPGYGYCLTEDPALPPQTFSRLEIEALVLGLGYARSRGDEALSDAAHAALAKLVATLPERLQRQAVHAALRVHRFRPDAEEKPACLTTLREACWEERALDLAYRSADGAYTERRVLPLSVVYVDDGIVLLARCRLREDFRMFRASRIVAATPTDESFRPRRAALLREYLARLSGD